MKAASSSSSLLVDDHLIVAPLERLHRHPRNANVMSEERLSKLVSNIEREGRYPPLVARPHPEIDGDWQLLDGAHRAEALRGLGHQEALVFPWPCDDATALVLLATLNRLEGEDVPARRAGLLAELSAMTSTAALADLLPESAAQIEDTIALLDLDTDALLAELTAASNLRAHSESEVGAPVVTGGPHAAAISESSERQRAAKSRRCSARGIESPRPRRQRKYCRNSSNAEQKRAADAKLPKPRIG